MRIKKLFVNHFGKIENTSIEFPPGITVISGENESGKSTLHTFITSMIFGLERGRGRAAKHDTFMRFTPWNGGTYGGKIEIEKEDGAFEITRNFSGEDSGVIITDEENCKLISPSSANISKIFCGLTPTSYQNTISIGQLSASTGGELADELRNHIINLRSAGSFSLDVTNAVTELKTQKKRNDATFSKTLKLEAEELHTRIASLEADLMKDESIMTVKKLEGKKATLFDNVSRLESERDALIAGAGESDAFLRSKHIYSDNDLSELSGNIEESIETIVNFKRHHRFDSRRFAKPLWKAFLVLFAVCFAALLSLLIYMISGAGSTLAGDIGSAFNGQFGAFGVFGSGSLLPVIIGLMLFAGLFILCLINLSTIKKYSLSLRMFKDLYANIFNEKIGGPVTKSHVDRLVEQPDKIKAHLDRVASSKNLLNEYATKITEARKSYEASCASLDRAKEAAWQREQKENALSELRLRIDSLSDKLSKNDEIQENSEAFALAINTIETISNDVFESFGHFLEGMVSELFSSMTGGAYDGVSISESLDITLIQSEKRVPLSSVSAGTLDQIYLALRLACIEFLWPDHSMPLLLDDTFALYDEGRLSNTLTWLSENYSGQIIIFTCHTREKRLLDGLNIPYNLVVL